MLHITVLESGAPLSSFLKEVLYKSLNEWMNEWTNVFNTCMGVLLEHFSCVSTTDSCNYLTAYYVDNSAESKELSIWWDISIPFVESRWSQKSNSQRENRCWGQSDFDSYRTPTWFILFHSIADIYVAPIQVGLPRSAPNPSAAE